jgi:hypothetical protein
LAEKGFRRLLHLVGLKFQLISLKANLKLPNKLVHPLTTVSEIIAYYTEMPQILMTVHARQTNLPGLDIML